MYQLTPREDELCKAIVDCAYTVHKKLGPGLLEKIYEACFCYELSKRGISYQRQVDVPIYYDDLYFNEGVRMDVYVENLIICELKAVELINPLWEAQVISHIRLTNKHVGFLLNFDVVLMKHGIRRFCVA